MSMTPDSIWIDMVPGVKRRTLVSGATMHQILVTLEKGSHLPEHRHTQEQIIHVVRGRLRATVAGMPHEIGPGEAFYLVSNVPHAVDALETTLVVDTFSPPREDMLAQDRVVARPV